MPVKQYKVLWPRKDNAYSLTERNNAIKNDKLEQVLKTTQMKKEISLLLYQGDKGLGEEYKE